MTENITYPNTRVVINTFSWRILYPTTIAFMDKLFCHIYLIRGLVSYGLAKDNRHVLCEKVYFAFFLVLSSVIHEEDILLIFLCCVHTVPVCCRYSSSCGITGSTLVRMRKNNQPLFNMFLTLSRSFCNKTFYTTHEYM